MSEPQGMADCNAFVLVYQDGAQFYEASDTEENKGPLWTAPPGTVRNDYDSEGATKARALFIEWAAQAGLRIMWEG